MSIIRAVFEPGIWKDFSKEHRTLREDVEATLAKYRAGRFCDPMAVWGAFGAGKTQFLFWVAERALDDGLIPIYFHLNDLLDGLPEAPSPDAFRDHASAFVSQVVSALRDDPGSQRLRNLFRDESLLSYVLERIDQTDPSKDGRPVLLVDEVEQAYITLRETVRADDRSPLRAWLEEPTFKVCAFAVGSMYVLGKADRERMRVSPIPAVRPSFAKELLSDIPEAAVNSLWWLSRGKPRHLMKAAQRLRNINPTGPIEIHEFVKDLDSVSQAPYDTDSQNVVPACYVEHFEPEELSQLMAIGPLIGQGDGKLFTLASGLQAELLTIIRDAFKMESVAFDLVRYVIMLLEATSVGGQFALRESDTPYLLRLAVDFLLEYERDRLEKETVEGGAALRKLLEVHDSAEQHAGQIFWKLQGKLGATQTAVPAVAFEAMAAAFPLPTTSPTLVGTSPGEVRRRYEDSKEPVFSWRDSAHNAVVFLTSTTALADYSETPEFRRSALTPTTGVMVLLPYDADEWRPSGFLEWLNENDRLRILRLPLALTDFLLSLRDSTKDGTDPFPIAERAESDANLKRQVAFYRSRLQAFVAESTCRPRVTIPNEIPKRFNDILDRIADKDAVTLAVQQAFEALSPKVHGFLVDLREFVVNSKTLWGRTGLISLADDLLPHRAAKTDRIEAAKVIDDIRAAFSAYTDTLRRLASFVNQDELEHLTDDVACRVALRSFWQTKRGATDLGTGDLSNYNAQVADFILTLTAAREAEIALKKYGVRPTFGTVGTLMDALPYLQKLAADVTALLASPGGADRHLAAALFEQFLATLVDAVGSDVNDAKTAVSSAKASIKRLTQGRKRVLEAAHSDSAKFAGLDATGLGTLLDELQHDAVAQLPSPPSLDDTASAFEDAAKDFESVEDALARLEAAYQQISLLGVKQPWKQDRSSL